MTQIDAAAESTRAAGLTIKALSDLGYEWRRQDGGVHTVMFSAVGYGELRGAVFCVLEVDTLRLPRRVTARDLTKPETVHHIATVCGHPARVLNSTGVTYVLRLTPAPAVPRLPRSVALDLSARPAGLSVPVGVGRSGPVWRDLAAMGHTLITGASGSGKSNWLHAALAALLSGASPEVLRLAVVDPKVSEFAAWGRVPHLWAPIASDEAGAVRLLGAVVSELDRRGELLAGALVRDLAGYNRGAAVKLPVLLVCFDEVLDLVLAAGGERSELARLLTRLAVKGRSAGVFLWVASQHARFDLLPRAVTVNMHSRLVFRVGDQAAANMAGCPGAERIGRDVPGRFLAALDGGVPAGFQAFNLADGELLAVVSGIVGAAVGPAPVVLSDVERALVQHAVSDLDGGFIVGKLAAVFRDRGITHHQVRGIAERWERDGLLTAPASITAPRMVTGALATLAGVDLRHVVGAE
jgi:hypothetical protein